MWKVEKMDKMYSNEYNNKFKIKKHIDNKQKNKNKIN
jgi:hypothetical protein